MVSRLHEAVEHVANDEAVRQNVRHMQHLAHEAGGYQPVVEAILPFT